MKIGTSTLGCPDWTLPQILSNVKSYGFDGIELRGIGTALDLSAAPEFATTAAAAETKRRITDSGLEVSAIDTSTQIAHTDIASAGLDEAKRAIDLAFALGASFVRVFGGGPPNEADPAGSIARAQERLMSLGEYAGRTGTVSVVLETHDAFSTGTQVAAVLSTVDNAYTGALWDLHHPYRQGETPEQTYAALAPFVRLTHVKDSTPPNNYCLLGDGDIPILPMLRLLHGGGYDGWINLEWEKRWIPRLADPSVAFSAVCSQAQRVPGELTSWKSIL